MHSPFIEIHVEQPHCFTVDTLYRFVDATLATLATLGFSSLDSISKKLFVHSQNHKKIKSGGSERFLVVQQCGKCCRSSHSHSRSTLRGAKEDHLRSSEWLDGNGIHRSWCGTMRISRSCGSPNHADLRTMRISEPCGSQSHADLSVMRI
jgi:hypothetical protein